MSATYWLIVTGEVKGPYGPQELLAMEKTGEVYESSLVRGTEPDVVDWMRWDQIRPEIKLPGVVRILADANAFSIAAPAPVNAREASAHLEAAAAAASPAARVLAAPARTSSHPEEPPRLNRGVYIFLAVFLGSIGLHNFYAKHYAEGLIQAGVSVVGFLICLFGSMPAGLCLFGIVGLWLLVNIIAQDKDGESRYMI